MMDSWERRLWWLLWPVLTGLAVTGEVVQARAGTSLNVVIEFLGGYAFLVAGLIAWRRRPENHFGRLMTLAGVTWFVGQYADASVNTVQSIGNSFRGFVPIAISHLALTYPDGRLAARAERVLIVVGYAVVGLASVVVLATFNPHRDFHCKCPSAPFGLFSNPPLLRLAYNNKDKLAGAVVLIAVILLVRRLLRANVTQRWLLSPLWIVAAVAGTTFIARTTVNFISLSDHAAARVDNGLNAITMLVPAAFLVGLLRNRLDASPLGDLVVALGGRTSGETLQRALARTLRDPSVELAYWLPARGVYVDAAGLEFSFPGDNGSRAVTLVERDGERLAALVHDRSLLENPRLVEATTAAAGLSLDNERLQAELRAQIEEVRASRVRIIEASDDARRRIERDLHDGAQQRLLATALSLRMANDALDDGADPDTRRALEAAAADTLLAVTDLRELAQGIHPTILTEQGLRAAVDVLAERAPVAVAVDVPADRYTPSIEATAYFVISEALSNVAKHASATKVSVRARQERGNLVVDVHDDGRGGATEAGGTGLRGLNDRVAALGGRLEVRSPPGNGTFLRIELPCS
jgi:signal transduction histidine kinase